MGNVASVKKDFTKGSIPIALIKYALPLMAANALQAAYTIVDMMVVGNYAGEAELAAVATAGQAVTLMTALSMGFCAGGQVFIAGIMGKNGGKEGLNRAIGTLFTLILIASALVGVTGAVFSEDIILLLRTPEESTSAATKYLTVSLVGAVFPFGYNAVSAVLRGLGNSIRPLVYVAISACVNVGCNFLFVGALGLGAEGSAYATVVGQAVAFGVSVGYIFVRRREIGFDFKAGSFVPEKDSLKSLFTLGVPLALRSGAVNASTLFLTSYVNMSGVADSAIFGVGLKTDDLARKIAIGINYAVSTFSAQNHAAGEDDRVKKSVYVGLALSFAVYAIFALLYVFDIRGVFGLFTDDREILDRATVFSSAIIYALPAMVTMRATNGFIQGIGKSVTSFVLALADGIVLRLGLAYLFGIVLDMGVYGLFLGYGLASYGSAVPGMLFFLFGKWKKKGANGVSRQ